MVKQNSFMDVQQPLTFFHNYTTGPPGSQPLFRVTPRNMRTRAESEPLDVIRGRFLGRGARSSSTLPGEGRQAGAACHSLLAGTPPGTVR